MKILKLELHKYAPELNKVHLKNGVVLNAPHCTTIKDFRNSRKQNNKKPSEFVKYISIKVIYLDGSFNKYISRFLDYNNLASDIKAFKKTKNLDGTKFDIRLKSCFM